jgi:hypothetical protein
LGLKYDRGKKNGEKFFGLKFYQEKQTNFPTTKNNGKNLWNSTLRLLNREMKN